MGPDQGESFEKINRGPDLVQDLGSRISDLDAQGRAAAATKLEQVVELGKRIAQSEGGEVANSVLEHGLIEVALLRCREIQDGKAGLDYDDLQIYYRYATSAIQKAEALIDKELAHLDL